MTNWAYISAL